MGRKLGLCPFWGGQLGPQLTQCSQGQGLPACQVSSWSIQPIGHSRHGPKIGGLLSPWEGGCVPIEHNAAKAYLRTKWHLDSAVGLNTWAESWGLLSPFWGEELGPHLTQCRLGRGLPFYQVASWSIQAVDHNRYGPKIGGSAPLEERELGPHLKQYGQGRGLPACQVSSWSIQPFGHNSLQQRHRQDRRDRTGQTDNGPIATVAQKPLNRLRCRLGCGPRWAQGTTPFIDAFVNERLQQLLPGTNDYLLASSPWMRGTAEWGPYRTFV